MPDVGRVQLLPEDSMVIMASDGLWDVLSDQQAVETAEVWSLRHVPCVHERQIPPGTQRVILMSGRLLLKHHDNCCECWACWLVLRLQVRMYRRRLKTRWRARAM